jgi:hypothetical protein
MPRAEVNGSLLGGFSNAGAFIFSIKRRRMDVSGELMFDGLVYFGGGCVLPVGCKVTASTTYSLFCFLAMGYQNVDYH